MSDNCLVCEVLMQCRELAGNTRDFPFHCAVCQKDNNCEPLPISKQQFVSTVSSPCLSRQYVVPSATAPKEELVDEQFRSQDVLDDCFYIPRSPCGDYNFPDVQERSLSERAGNIFQEDGPVRFEVLEKGTKRGSKLLVDSDGFTYTVKRNNKSSTNWTCSIRNQRMHCRATVLQRGDTFTRGRVQHCHLGDPKLPILRKVSTKAKELIKNQQCGSARDIVRNAASDVLQGGDEPSLLVSQTSNLIRAVNRHRALHRPAPATDRSTTERSAAQLPPPTAPPPSSRHRPLHHPAPTTNV